MTSEKLNRLLKRQAQLRQRVKLLEGSVVKIWNGDSGGTIHKHATVFDAIQDLERELNTLPEQTEAEKGKSND